MEEKDKKIKNITDELEKLNRDNQNFDNQIKTMKKQIKTLKSTMNSLSEENKTFKNSIKDYVSELEFLREKEMKMMEVMYILKNRGVQFDDIIKEAANIRKYKENLTEESVTSNATVYFPDKISMSTGNLNKANVYIPPLNFSNIPNYESEDENKKNKK
jgi:chromosome segregation ATPase